MLMMNTPHERAIAHYRAAAERTTSIPERNYLLVKAARLSSLTQRAGVSGPVLASKRGRER